MARELALLKKIIEEIKMNSEAEKHISDDESK